MKRTIFLRAKPRLKSACEAMRVYPSTNQRDRMMGSAEFGSSADVMVMLSTLMLEYALEKLCIAAFQEHKRVSMIADICIGCPYKTVI